MVGTGGRVDYVSLRHELITYQHAEIVVDVTRGLGFRAACHAPDCLTRALQRTGCDVSFLMLLIYDDFVADDARGRPVAELGSLGIGSSIDVTDKYRTGAC